MDHWIHIEIHSTQNDNMQSLQFNLSSTQKVTCWGRIEDACLRNVYFSFIPVT
uniref:Uncharacterized protein n=1 Tax=Arion vulgaris TaxID=1028688 RepID=A0A0B7ANX5_9EUPU